MCELTWPGQADGAMSYRPTCLLHLSKSSQGRLQLVGLGTGYEQSLAGLRVAHIVQALPSLLETFPQPEDNANTQPTAMSA